MAVLIEGISVVVRVDRITNNFRGGIEAFKTVIPNQNFCADEELVRIGFMAPDDARGFVSKLEDMGLHFLNERKAIDIVVVDQLCGPTTDCDWAEFGHIARNSQPSQKIAVIRMAGSNIKQVAIPSWWEFEGSLSQSHGFVQTENLSKKYRFLRKEQGVEVYLDLETGQEKYIGRTNG